MATQFYRTLDEIMRLKQENSDRIQNRISEINEHSVEPDYTDALANMRKLAGLDGRSSAFSDQSIEGKFIDKSERIQFIKEHNIKHGSPRWFKVMYARPELTGEDPFGE